MVNDTLFSCGIDFETMQVTNVKEELSLGKGRATPIPVLPGSTGKWYLTETTCM